MSQRRSDSDEEGASAPADVALVLDQTDDRSGYRVLRRRDTSSEIELGTIRPLQEGRPIEGEVVSLRQRPDLPFAYDVKTELAAPERSERRFTEDGPAQIATEQYRRGWDAIWGEPSRKDLN